MGDLASFGNRMQRITSGSVKRSILTKAGMAAKKAALDAAEDALGGDRSFSGMRRKAKLGAGFDTTGDSRIQLNLRPAGLWSLAESGRRASGPIRPRAKKAVLTPMGPRSRSSFGPSRGNDAVSNAWKHAAQDAPRAARKQFAVEVRKLVK